MKPEHYPDRLRDLVLADGYGTWTNSDRTARLHCTPHMWKWNIDGHPGMSDMVEDVIAALAPVRA